MRDRNVGMIRSYEALVQIKYVLGTPSSKSLSKLFAACNVRESKECNTPNRYSHNGVELVSAIISRTVLTAPESEKSKKNTSTCVKLASHANVSI